MGLMNYILIGVPLWIWLFLLSSILLMVIMFLLGSGDSWEKFKGWYYKKKHPERLIKVIVHYKSGMYQVFWKLTPDKDTLKIKRKDYIYDNADVIKPKGIIEGDDILLNLDDKALIKEKKGKFPEIHYAYNVPFPMRFDFKDEENKIKFSSHSLKEFKENDLFEKLLRLKGEKGFMMFLLIMVIFNTAISGFMLAKQMGWLE